MRLRLILIEVYKSLIKANPAFINDLFTHRTVTYSLRDNKKLETHKQMSTTYGIRSFTYIGAKLWNDLPPAFKLDLYESDVDESLKALKLALMSWNGPKDMGYFNNYV